MSRSAKIRYTISVGCALLALLIPLLARAAVSVQGHVLDTRGSAVSGATVTLSGANRSIGTLSHSDGSFAFINIVEGEYELRARAAAGTAAFHVMVADAPVTVELRLTLQTLGRVVSVSSAPSLRSGGSTLISAAQLAHSPANNNLANVFVQLPSAARGSNGQIHINGDHGDINYSLDGVPLPQALNRVIGSEVDTSDIGYLDVIEGAYPAKYGGKFGAVVNIATVAGTGAHGGYIETSVGSQGDATVSLLQHGALGPRGGMTLSLRQARTGWALDPPVRDAAHDRGSTSNQFLRVTLPAGLDDSWNFDLSHVAQTFQIPPDTANGTPANTDDVETQNDAFASASFHHAIGLDGALTVNAFGKASTIKDFPDLANDFAAAPGDNCSGANPNAPSSCLFAAASARLARDLGGSLSYSHTSPRHTIESGVLYDATNVTKIYGLLLQPDNYLAPGSLVATAIVDTSPNTAHSMGAYLQDGWQLSTANRVDAGVRYDEFTIFSTTFRNGFSQVSPRLRFTHVVNDRTSWYGYYGRLFTPFSFENVSPQVAQLINPASGLAFDLQPARESLYEIGGAFGVGGDARGSWKIAHKSLVNVIDDAQVGTTNIHQDINFGKGRADFQDVLLEFPHGNGTHDYVSLTHSRAVNRGCGSQLLSGCLPPPYDWFDADHDQRWDASAGKEMTLAKGGWLALTAEFGSGLSTGVACDRCKVPPHLTFDASFGHPLSNKVELVVNVHNLLDDRYALTLNSALQGTHYARPFSVDAGVRMHY